MPFRPDRRLEFRIKVAHPALLEGLDAWLQLGLLSDEQVRILCEDHLACSLAQAPMPVEMSSPQQVIPVPESVPVPAGATDFLPDLPPPPTPPARRQAPPPRREPRPDQEPWVVTRMLQSLMAEISVLWLLLLGVFLVVVSSAVLAASQWSYFSAAGQYSILLGYTLAFWVASAWAGQRQDLRLTARMLQVATLLIIPLNFWMMDGFQLGQTGGGLVVGAIGAIGLSGVLIHLLQQLPPVAGATHSQVFLVNSLGLCWLHWGWGMVGVPVLANYLGSIGTTAALVYQLGRGTQAPSPSGESGDRSLTGSLRLLFLGVALSLLFVRAVFTAGVPVTQLGLAVGVCGWLLGWLGRTGGWVNPWTRSGLALLLVSWVITAPAAVPWQAIVISVLGMVLLSDRVQRWERLEDTTALFLVGLQGMVLLWRVVPGDAQQATIAVFTQFFGAGGMPLALVGLGVFPYVGLTLAVAGEWRRSGRDTLADHIERLALILGLGLLAVSALNGWVRSINWPLSTVALAMVVRGRRQVPDGLIYVTHLVGVGAVLSWIDRLQPDLGPIDWAGVLLAMMLAEWGFCALSRRRIWQKSAWLIGLGLAGVSYGLLLDGDWGGLLSDASLWSVIWLVTPIALTALGNRPNFPFQTPATWLSVGALLAVQLLTLEFDGARLVSLGVATAVMLVNTRQLMAVLAAALTIGFGLATAYDAVWEVRDGVVGVDLAVNVVAVSVLGLWVLWHVLADRSSELSDLYAGVADGWAGTIAGILLVVMTGFTAVLFVLPPTSGWEYLVATVVLTGAFGFRYWRRSGELWLYGLGWGVELTIAGAIALSGTLSGSSLNTLGLANLALALVLQLAGDWWCTRRSTPYPTSWHVLPLLYGAIGLALLHREFTAYTGLYTLAAVLVGIGVGRRLPALKPLTYLSIFGVSAAAYELLIYQLSQTEGGAVGDGVVLLAGLAAGLAVSLRVLGPWLKGYLRLGEGELGAIAHLHWLGGNGLLVLALLSSRSETGDWLWVGIMAVYSGYGLLTGRTGDGERPEGAAFSLSELWTHLGIFEGLLALTYLLFLVLPEPGLTLLHWGAAIACPLAAGMYLLPWNTWGWSIRPWRQAAAVLPIAVVVVTCWGILLQSLLIVAAFYAWLAQVSQKIRLSYLSVLLADWAILRLMVQSNVMEPLLYSALLSISLLYGVQVDPGLRSRDQLEKRHALRCLALGLLCLTALYQSDRKLLLSLITLGLGLGLGLAGLALRIRAFLYVGTATFVIKVLREVWVLISEYSLLLWAVGIVLGLLFIWVAATFEARRAQMITLLESWLEDLGSWE